ncbi:MAG: hypothetical protein Kow0059_00860 [Candidatus Sumerlaeia bacterium]
MFDLNRVFIVGRVTRKPELRYLPSQTALAEFSIAYNRRYRSKSDNDLKEEAHFFSVKTFGRSAEFAAEHLDKGKGVFIEGRLCMEKWEAKDGTSREKIVIVADRIAFAESRGAENAGSGGNFALNGERKDYSSGNYTSHTSSPDESNTPPDNDDPDSGSQDDKSFDQTTNDLPF